MSLNVLSVPRLILCWSRNPSGKGIFGCKAIYENNCASSATTLRLCCLACKNSKCLGARRTIKIAALPMILRWSRNPWGRVIFGCKAIYENNCASNAKTLRPCFLASRNSKCLGARLTIKTAVLPMQLCGNSLSLPATMYNVKHAQTALLACSHQQSRYKWWNILWYTD